MLMEIIGERKNKMLVFELTIRNRARCNIALTGLPNANLTKALLIFETH